VKIHIESDPETLAQTAATLFLDELKNLPIDGSTRRTIVLTGGRSPLPLYRVLRERSSEAPWKGVHIYWSDERYVSAEHSDSNQNLVNRHLLRYLPLNPASIHPIATGFPSVEEAASANGSLLGTSNPHVPPFDIVLLSLGEDGHVASLFPGSAALTFQKPCFIPIRNAPKPPAERITMSLPCFTSARFILLLATGESKAPAVARLRNGDPQIPATRLAANTTAFHLFADRSAWGHSTDG
jgi:6-phosphogluconolactonase